MSSDGNRLRGEAGGFKTWVAAALLGLTALGVGAHTVAPDAFESAAGMIGEVFNSNPTDGMPEPTTAATTSSTPAKAQTTTDTAPFDPAKDCPGEGDVAIQDLPDPCIPVVQTLLNEALANLPNPRNLVPLVVDKKIGDFTVQAGEEFAYWCLEVQPYGDVTPPDHVSFNKGTWQILQTVAAQGSGQLCQPQIDNYIKFIASTPPATEASTSVPTIPPTTTAPPPVGLTPDNLQDRVMAEATKFQQWIPGNYQIGSFWDNPDKNKGVHGLLVPLSQRFANQKDDPLDAYGWTLHNASSDPTQPSVIVLVGKNLKDDGDPIFIDTTLIHESGHGLIFNNPDLFQAAGISTDEREGAADCYGEFVLPQRFIAAFPHTADNSLNRCTPAIRDKAFPVFAQLGVQPAE